jgi:glutaredoxin
VKGFLSKKGVAFEVRDVHEDESAQAELMNLGFTAIPVVVIGKQPPILGADLKKIEAALSSR